MPKRSAKPEDFPKLPPQTKKVFLQFVDLANKSILHPSLDMERFYRFVRFCHTRRVELDKQELRKYLIRAGFGRNDSERLSNIYCHGRKLLAVRA